VLQPNRKNRKKRGKESSGVLDNSKKDKVELRTLGRFLVIVIPQGPATLLTLDLHMSVMCVGKHHIAKQCKLRKSESTAVEAKGIKKVSAVSSTPAVSSGSRASF